MPKLAISLLSSFIEAAEGPRGQALYAPPRQPTPVRASDAKAHGWSLEKLDEGRQKPNACHGGPSPVCEDTDTEGGPGSERDRGITGAPVGLIDVKASKILAYRCMPKHSSGHAGHESWMLPV